MGFNPIYGTGFEMGRVPLLSGDYSMGISSGGHTGNFHLYEDGDGSANFDVGVTASELYVGVWVRHAPTGSNQVGNFRIRFIYADGNHAEIYYDGNDHYDAYVDGTKIADGALAAASTSWHNIQVYILKADSGIIQTRIDGTDDINYSGDTNPGGATTIETIRLATNGISLRAIHIDDFVFGDDGWPGDIRYEPLVAVGDTATEEWDVLSGSDSYAMVDDVGPNDSEYINTTTNGEQTIVALDNWDATEKTPEHVMIWGRVKKDVADAHQIKLISDDGSNTNIHSAEDILTSYTYIHQLLTKAPDGFDWTDTKVDTLNVGVESVVV